MDLNLTTTSDNYLSNIINNKNFGNPIVLLSLSLVVIFYIFFFNSLGKDYDKVETSASIQIIEVIFWSVFILLMLLNGFNYIFNVDIVTSISNFFSNEPTININIKRNIKKPPVPEIMAHKQVFNIPENIYDYNNAEALCKAYGADLASWKNIKDAYDKGADWCNYGWSKDQMILFPTQYNKWLKLQKINGHENDCGRPGINGGYNPNSTAKFGVNCYGFKPVMNSNDMANMNKNIYPKTKENIYMDNLIDYWKNKLSNIIVSPFNNHKWSNL